MLKRQNFTLISILLLSFILAACGKAELNMEVDVDPDPKSPALVSADINLQKISINLNQKNTADVILTRKFDDDTETTLNLVVSWNEDDLFIKDDSGNAIALEFDKEKLLIGETDIKFKDPVSNRNIAFKLALVPITIPPAIISATLNVAQLTIDLNTSDVSTANLIRKYDNDTEVREDVTFQWINATSTLILKDASDVEISLNYDVSNLDLISVSFIDPVSNHEVEIEITIVQGSEPPVTINTVSKIEINDANLTVIEKLKLTLSVTLTYANGETTLKDFDVVKCKSSSVFIEVTPACVITGISPGEATIDLEMLTDDQPILIGSHVQVVDRSITQLTLTPSNPVYFIIKCHSGL